jgi:hypothetical protein
MYDAGLIILSDILVNESIMDKIKKHKRENKKAKTIPFNKRLILKLLCESDFLDTGNIFFI